MSEKKVTYTVPSTPSGGTSTKTITVVEERIDGDWTYFKCKDGSSIAFPTRWIKS